ncbi:MAG: uroporphyrinogen decarboxylase family protein [Thermofilaceae archaeon]
MGNGLEELLVSVFEGAASQVPFNIRHEYWYHFNKRAGTLPREYEGLDLPDICERWGATWRCYSGYYVESCVKVEYEGVEFRVERIGERRELHLAITPYGTLRRVVAYDLHGLSAQTLEYPIKGVSDFKPLEYVLESVKVKFDHAAYERLRARVGTRGFVTFFFPHSPLQALFLDWAGIPTTARLLRLEKRRTEELMGVINEHNWEFYRELAKSPMRVLNLGENIDARITSPELFKRYCVPVYREAADYLHSFGKYVHIHVDGYARKLLPLLRETGLDGVEALTPKPAGDFTLEEAKRELGDTVVLDGVPYLLFLPHIERDLLRRFVERLIELFKGRLILGISDELPPPADLERVRLVSEILREAGG